MVSVKQKRAAKRNIKKAQKKWKSMSKSQHVRAQPQGRGRKRPGAGGKGEFYRIVVRPKSDFIAFRTQDVGGKGHIERIAGRRKNGSWATQAWLIAKTDASMKGGTLIGKTKHAKQVLSKLTKKPEKIKGNLFEAKPRKNVPERAKPTPAMGRARARNIKKAQAVWRKRHL